MDGVTRFITRCWLKSIAQPMPDERGHVDDPVEYAPANGGDFLRESACMMLDGRHHAQVEERQSLPHFDGVEHSERPAKPGLAGGSAGDSAREGAGTRQP